MKQSRTNRRRGSILIFVALSLPMLLGFCALAVDYGILTVDANRLQRGCDAAALAGASKLKRTNDGADVIAARAEAIQVAAKNGVTLNPGNIIFPNDAASRADWSRIRVNAGFTRPLLFAPILRMFNGTSMTSAGLARYATAAVKPVVTIPQGFVPLVITTKDYDDYIGGGNLSLSLIRMQGNQDFVPGKVIGIRTDPSNNGKSPSQWEDDVRDGTSDDVNINDNDVAINAALNNSSNRLNNALQNRISNAVTAGWNPGVTQTAAEAAAAYPDYPGSTARRIFVMGVAAPTASSNGNQNITLLKFVRVYVVSSSDGAMTIRLLPDSIVSSEGNYTTGGSSSTGLSTVSMIDDI